MKNETQHTPDEWYLAYDPDLNDTSLASLVTRPDLHALKTQRETDGNIQCKYVPVSIAIHAPETADERDRLKEENEKLITGNAELRVKIDELKEEIDNLKWQLENADSCADQALDRVNELQSLNAELVEALEKAYNEMRHTVIRVSIGRLLQKAKDL